jgi:hypothetical protein
MNYRKACKIAWTTAWGIACLLLVVLWVRSYSWVDNIIGPSKGSSRFGVATANGWLTVRYGNGKFNQQAFPEWTLLSTSAAEMEETYKQMEDSIKRTTATFSRPIHRFGWIQDWGFQFPYWLPAVLLLTLAVAPWLRMRFSLRTLLIGMTVAAVLLGIVVYVIR